MPVLGAGCARGGDSVPVPGAGAGCAGSGDTPRCTAVFPMYTGRSPEKSLACFCYLESMLV